MNLARRSIRNQLRVWSVGTGKPLTGVDCLGGRVAPADATRVLETRVDMFDTLGARSSHKEFSDTGVAFSDLRENLWFQLPSGNRLGSLGVVSPVGKEELVLGR